MTNLESKTDIPLCTIISETATSGTEESGCYDNGNLTVPLLKRCCQACAWREEQLRQSERLKLQTSPTSKLLQKAANAFLSTSSDDGDTCVKVHRASSPLSERKIRYANILAHAIQCKTVSFDEPSHNMESKKELKKLHKLLQSSFPLLYKKYPPKVVNQYSLLFKISGEKEQQKPIMLCAHLDVVPAPTNSDNPWGREPFSGDIIDGIIWGRGGEQGRWMLI